MKHENIYFESYYPITLYILISALLLQGILLTPGGSIGKVLFYSLLMFLFFYMLLLRFACRLKIKEDVLEVVYAFPWDKKIVIDLAKVESIDYAKGFYDPFSNQSLGGLFVFPKYCYDQLILEVKGEEVLLTLNINTRIFQFDKCFKTLKTLIK
jgi:hypothetical protein